MALKWSASTEYLGAGWIQPRQPSAARPFAGFVSTLSLSESESDFESEALLINRFARRWKMHSVCARCEKGG